MANILVIVVLLAIVGIAVAYLVQAKRNGAACVGCPSGGSCGAKKPPKKRLDGPVIGKKTIRISGMHCAHCVTHVTEALNQIPGVRARVSLAEGSAHIAYDREISEQQLRQALEQIGYQVSGIS